MLIASIELQKAIYSCLSNVYRVENTKPVNPSFPFVEIGLEIERDMNTKTDERTFHFFTIHTFCKGESEIASKQMNHHIKTLLKNLVVEGFNIDQSKLSNRTTLKETETDTTVFHGVLDFEFILTKL